MSEQRAVDVAQRLVGLLLGRGVTDVVLSPGSRSGPLALALHAADTRRILRLHVRVDEREGAFLALGLAKASGRPVPVVTTSGTAVANLHPALLEALHAQVPVLAVTADRPGRLRGTGANQTTDQRAIFPRVPYADGLDDLVRVWSGGPAHVNLELDEPLVEPTVWTFEPIPTKAPVAPRAITELSAGPRTVVIAGDAAGPEATRLAERAGWPVLADPSSGARWGDHALTAYRLLLGQPQLADGIERVVSFGHATLSRPVTRLLSRSDVEIVHVGDQRTFPGPAGDNVRFADAVTVAPGDDRAWLSRWKDADERVLAALPDAPVFEVARAVWDALGHDGLLYVGSSNPVRDLDLVARPGSASRQILANRGLAGIDGVPASAIGAALARPERRALAYLGDLTFLHGSNGLLIGPDEPRADLTIVVASDDGGSIFATLEQGAPEYADAFERVYATPTGADLAALCAGYRVPHRRVAPADLAAALAEPSEGIAVIEVPVPRHDRRALAEACTRAARSAV
ncbi:2-succinyl-5-enolpyruvyl-6-hydroxy-3-cyclohexene-1-carboxylate synthase [Aeromicrobium phragmitis]|uniref:2-succinyl-5-enolpyruvyl-6-hydroxy-3-cyclohexene-1-carboxylate synthase n=1 Tax=Aeromicrobium phragmitis TaxID=2478914 RepID=A0A3L8PNS1_9ACTN|nr:thiamine pyrophosphate-binding protein [Aeromicrobium phragmitis]RLV56343.1 2-succinyl-5-enolpyruvyl-6-hydroxy-3-cyclohexene-1-carboxylate synthase [Aeromicrobium phragmitis]